MFTRKRKDHDPAGDGAPVDPAGDGAPVDPAGDGAPVDPAGDGAPVDPAGQLDEYRRRLFDALVVADGRVRDVAAVEYAPELVDDPDALAAKITSVIESRPEVGRNAAFGDVGAGESGDAPAPDLIDVIRAAHDAAN